MPTPDIIAVCDACVDRIKAGWANPAKPEAAVERVYEFEVPDPREGLASVEGRRVYVFPDAYDQPGTASRLEDVASCVVAVLVVEVYPHDERPVPRAWLDERVRWAKAQIFDRLGDARAANMLAEAGKPNTTGVYPDGNRCESVYDLVTLRGHAAFWGEFSFTFNWHE